MTFVSRIIPNVIERCRPQAGPVVIMMSNNLSGDLFHSRNPRLRRSAGNGDIRQENFQRPLI